MKLPYFLRLKGIPLCRLISGMTDIHSHLFPGIDDGIPNRKDCVTALNSMLQMGIKRIVCTPHIMENYPLNSKVYLSERFGEFQSLLPEGMEGHLAAEYMLDSKFAFHLPEGLLAFAGRKVLLEMSYFSESQGWDNMLYEVALNGYQPVLAHPERYIYLCPEKYAVLKDRGCFFQLNLFSVCGYYGREVQQRAEWLLKRGYYDFAGTDLHKVEQCDLLSTYSVDRKTAEKIALLAQCNDVLWEDA